jgi:hypothetical protein
MIAVILNYLKARLLNIFPDIDILPLAVKEHTAEGYDYPFYYCSSGEYKPIDFDHSKAVIYMRQEGDMRISELEDEEAEACGYEQERIWPFRVIGWFPKSYYDTDNAYIENKIAENVVKGISFNSIKALNAALKVNSVEIKPSKVTIDRMQVYRDEMDGAEKLPGTDKVFFAVDIDIRIKGSVSCFDWWACNDTEVTVEPGQVNVIISANCEQVAACQIIIDITEELANHEERITALEDNPPSGLTCEDLPGCSTIQNIEQEIADEATARAGADTTLQSNIDNEATARSNADTALQGNIDTEAGARVAADNAEAATRAAADAAEATTRANADSTLSGIINTHIADTGNPHNTTLEQARSENNQISGPIDANGQTIVNLPTPSAAQDATPKAYADQVLIDAKSYADGLVTSILRDAGNYDASVGTWPTTGTGSAGAVRKGDTYNVTVAGTLGGRLYDINDSFRALVNNPGQTNSNWAPYESNTGQATEAQRGTAAIATQAEAQDAASLEDTKFVTPKKLWLAITYFLTQAWTFAAKITFTSAPKFNSATASRYLKTDANKELTDVANIPASDITGTKDHTFISDFDAEALAAAPAETAASLAAIDHAANAKTTLVDDDEAVGQDSENSYGRIRFKLSNLYLYIKAKFDGLLKDASGGYVGLTLFKINFKNAANTFTSFFTNSNTGARTYIFQDRNGTIADDTDLALKVDKTSESDLFVPVGDAGTANVTTIATGETWFKYVGRAKKAYSNARFLFRIQTAGVNVTWAEVCLYKGALVPAANASLTRIGFIDMTSSVNQATKNVAAAMAIAAGDDLWVGFGALIAGGGTVPQIKATTPDSRQAGNTQTVTGRPSTSPTLNTTLATINSTGPDIAVFLS